MGCQVCLYPASSYMLQFANLRVSLWEVLLGDLEKKRARGVRCGNQGSRWGSQGPKLAQSLGPLRGSICLGPGPHMCLSFSRFPFRSGFKEKPKDQRHVFGGSPLSIHLGNPRNKKCWYPFGFPLKDRPQERTSFAQRHNSRFARFPRGGAEDEAGPEDGHLPPRPEDPHGPVGGLDTWRVIFGE